MKPELVAAAFDQSDVRALTGTIDRLEWCANLLQDSAPRAARNMRRYVKRARRATAKIGAGGATLWIDGGK